MPLLSTREFTPSLTAMKRTRPSAARPSCSAPPEGTHAPAGTAEDWKFAAEEYNRAHNRCTISEQETIRFPEAKPGTGGAIVLGLRQQACVRFLASLRFFPLESPAEFFGRGNGSRQDRRGSRAVARQRGERSWMFFQTRKTVVSFVRRWRAVTIKFSGREEFSSRPSVLLCALPMGKHAQDMLSLPFSQRQLADVFRGQDTDSKHQCQIYDHRREYSQKYSRRIGMERA